MGDYENYEHKAGSGKTLISHPVTGEPTEVDVDEFGAPIMPKDEPAAAQAAAPAPED